MGLAITDGPDRLPLASHPAEFTPAVDDPQRSSRHLHRGHLEATGHDLRSEPFKSYLDGLAAVFSQAMWSQERVDSTRQEMRTLFGTFPAAIAMSRNMGVTFVNSAWTVLTGGVNVGQSVVGWILERDRPRAARAIEKATPEPVMVRLAYDPSRWVELDASTQMAFDGQQVSLVVAREVTDQRAVRANRAIRDRIDTTRFVTSGVAHELNNPLTAMMANLEVAARRVHEKVRAEPWTRELASDIAEAQEAAEAMRKAIRDLRDIGREPGQHSEPVDIRLVVDGALAIARRMLGHRCRIERHYDDVPSVLGRADGLGHVMVALLRNAADAFARDDAESSRPASERPSHSLQIWIRRRQRQVTVEIADDGPGVSPEVEESLFEPFEGHGYGLGLTLSRRIVEALGGTLRYEPRNGRGALFRIALPVAEAYDTPAEPEPESHTLGRVLVIDDEPLIGRSVLLLLAPDYEVVCATTGAAGLDEVAANPNWSLLLLDLMMPGMGGVEVYEELERQHRDLLPRVVIVTGGIYTQQAHEFLERTGCATLTKPFDASDLLPLIRQLDS